MKRWFLRTGMHVVAPVVVLTAVTLTAFSLLTVSLAHQGQWWVEHTLVVISESRSLLQNMVDAETAERGYVMTGREDFLDPWVQAQENVPRLLEHLRQLTADNPDQQLHLGQMSAHIEAKMAFIRQTIAARRRGIPQPPAEKEIMDKLRTADRAFESSEQHLLSERTAQLNQRYYIVVSGSLLLGGCSLFSMVAALWYARRNLVRAEAAETVAQQAQKMESIGQLTGGIAHDFNNVLQIAITNIDLGHRKLGAQHPAASFLQTALLGLERGAKLTRHLLAFARRQPLRPEPVAVDRLLAEAALLLRRSLGEKYELEVIGTGNSWRALVDASLLQNAVVNLALNARDAMPEGGKLTIETSNVTLDAGYAAREADVTPGQYVLVAVSDSGCGMSPQAVARAFEPFYTTKPHGTGLGLAMVFGFIKQSGGHIKIYSEPGHGTTVKLYLPRTHQEEPRREALRQKPLRGQGETILVVEDDDNVRVGVVAQLLDLGYKVVAAPGGRTALDILSHDPRIDLLFTDVVLGGEINGRQLADRAREIHPGLPVVYTSGYTENAIVHHGRLDEGAILLSKPYQAEALARIIGDTLASCRGLEAPMPRAALSHTEPPPLPPEPAISSPTTPPLTILLVEDDDSIRAGLQMVLETAGHRVLGSGTATEALTLFDSPPWDGNLQDGKHEVDLVVTDLGLPDFSGTALATLLRDRRSDLPIIVATGEAVLPESPRPLRGRPLHLLNKPFLAPQLMRMIETAQREIAQPLPLDPA